MRMIQRSDATERKLHRLPRRCAPRNDTNGLSHLSLRNQCAHWLWQSRAGSTDRLPHRCAPRKPHAKKRTTINETAPVGRGHVLLNQRLCLRGQSPLVSRLDSATPSCSLSPPQAALASVPPPWQLRNAVQYRKFLRSRFADGTPRSLAQPFATKERYGCGIPLAGAISCTG